MPILEDIKVYTSHKWRGFKKGMRESLDQESGGSLRPVVDMITGAQMQGCLIALLPTLIMFETGNIAVDMFVISSLVTLIMAFIGIFGSIVRQIIDDDSEIKADTNLSVKVEFHRMDRWSEPQENLHWKALAWLITQRSKHQTKGEYRMVPFVPENDESGSESEQEDGVDLSQVDIPRFNILPRGDRELEIEHNGCNFIVQFDLSGNAGTNNNEGDNKEKREVNPMINREPPILIRRVDNEVATLEWMQGFLNDVSKMYAKDQCSKKRRARYERPADYSYWTFVQNLRSVRGLSSVALDKTQEELLLKDLETFTNDKDFYKRMGLPYRRGYLFSGKPGTGKTSLINAISATYNRDLYYIDLQEIKSDNELQSAFSSVPKNAIIVFEDIDAQSAEVHSRERRFALKKVDRFRLFHEKKMERKKKKVEELAEKDSDDEDGDEDNDGDNDEGDDEENKPAKKEKKAKRTIVDIVDDIQEDVFSDFGAESGGMMAGFGGIGGGGGGGGFGPALPSGLGGMDFGDLKIGKKSLFTGFTLSMLLNCLDGHMLNENIMVIMTTNHPEVLDPALIRPGRIDLHLSLGYCTRYQLIKMYQSVMDNSTVTIDFSQVPEHTIAPCDALRIMILYRSNPELIPIRLMERGIEILNGKPLTTGIQAGEAALSVVVDRDCKTDDSIEVLDVEISGANTVDESDNKRDRSLHSEEVYEDEGAVVEELVVIPAEPHFEEGIKNRRRKARK
ncbi:UNVERIFIED_CONTAM: hypothetical protein HDU68_008487 [Siphonaria sp. JEL0065]|nr:hypothetical protein HDU68_008487 [Siphonaria sp. JEL0065]